MEYEDVRPERNIATDLDKSKKGKEKINEPIIEDEVWKNIESKSEELAISSYSATWDNRDKQTVTLVLNNGSQNPTVKVSNAFLAEL